MPRRAVVSAPSAATTCFGAASLNVADLSFIPVGVFGHTGGLSTAPVRTGTGLPADGQEDDSHDEEVAGDGEGPLVERLPFHDRFHHCSDEG